MRFLIFFLLILTKISFCQSNIAENDSILDLDSWKIINKSGDEFDGTTPDSTLWQKGLWYSVSGDFAFKNENVTVSNGNLHLTAKVEQFNEKEYSIGAVESKFEFPEAPALIRVRARLLPDTANVCSAIWLQTWPEVERNPNPEIDIIEYFSRNEMHMNLFIWIKNNAG